MPYSYNGWSAPAAIRDLWIGNVEIIPGVRDNDDVYTVLRFVAEQFNERVEFLRVGWCWGYAYRLTTNDNSLSCHASGSAIDLNAPLHPFNVSPYANFSQKQIDTIHEIIADLPIVWGGDYRNTPDAMHFEIMGSAAAVAAAADRIRNGHYTKDWFDMATEAELRKVVREEIRDTDWIKMIGTKIATAVWSRTFKTVNGNGATVNRKASDYLKEIWTLAKGGKLPS